MYDELVKRLRICPDYNDGCVNCQHEHDLGCRTTTMREAADAIEELSREKDSLAKSVQEASESLRQRRPVVLCRDCVHFSAHSGTGSGYCEFLDIGTSQEAFCSNGDREEN